MKKIFFMFCFIFLTLSISCVFGSQSLKNPKSYGESIWKTDDNEKIKISITVDSDSRAIMIIDDGNISKRFICHFVADVIKLTMVNENNELIGTDGNFYEEDSTDEIIFYYLRGNVTKVNKKEYEFYFDKKDFYEIFYEETIEDESTISFHLDRVE